MALPAACSTCTLMLSESSVSVGSNGEHVTVTGSVIATRPVRLGFPGVIVIASAADAVAAQAARIAAAAGRRRPIVICLSNIISLFLLSLRTAARMDIGQLGPTDRHNELFQSNDTSPLVAGGAWTIQSTAMLIVRLPFCGAGNDRSALDGCERTMGEVLTPSLSPNYATFTSPSWAFASQVVGRLSHS